MNKKFNLAFLGIAAFFVWMSFTSVATGASGVVSPKRTTVLAYTVAVTTITPTISTFGVAATAQYNPGAVYAVFQGTGAWTNGPGNMGDFFMLYDSSYTQNVAGNTISCGQMSGLPLGVVPLTPHMVFNSSFTTYTRFDPPIYFENGLVACMAGATGSVGISWELGRGLTGQ